MNNGKEIKIKYNEKLKLINKTIEEIKDGSSSGADISANFDLDNGQRPAFYQTGRIILKSSATAPSGNVYVKYKHFTHGATGDFFSVNS